MRATTTKYFVMLINAVMLVVGGLLVSLGLYGMNVGSQVSHLVRTMAPTYTMLLGIVLILVSLWGIYAASNEDPLLLQIYLGVMSLLLLAQLILSSLVLARQADIDMMAYDAWESAYANDKDLLAKFEKSYACCGFASVYDRAVPRDCTDNKEFGFIFPCQRKVSGPLKSGLKMLGTAGLLLAAIEAVGLVLSYVLYADFATNYYSDGGRLGETRRLLHEGSIPATQYAAGGGAPGRA